MVRVLIGCGLSERAACDELLRQAKAGELTPEQTQMLRDGRTAQGRKSRDGWVNWTTVRRWYRRPDGQEAPTPTSLPDDDVLPWHALAVQRYAMASKPCLTQVHEWLVENWTAACGEKPPSLHQVNYFFRKKYSKGDQHLGRHTGSALDAKKFYQHRTAGGLPPWTVLHADGWTTHFTAPHPVTGEFVTLELWHAQDLATRYLPPMSIAMSECKEVIAKCIENAVRVGGVMGGLQTDSTRSMKNKTMSLDVTSSLAARLGITVVHPVKVGKSQTNGLAENLNAWLDREAKELATYQGKSMDSLAFKRQRKLTAKMVKARSAGDLVQAAKFKAQLQKQTQGIVFERHEDAVAWVRKVEAKWNNRPHSALPKVHDEALGRDRHMTPQESLDAARAAGWAPVAVDEADLVDIFRVHEQRKVIRETVVAYNKQRYYHPDLNAYDGEMVMVAIDPMDHKHVWVKDLQGRLICQAQYVAATGYHPLSMYEAMLEKRTDAALKRLDAKAEAVMARAAPQALEMEMQAPAIVLELPAVNVPRRAPATEPEHRGSVIDTWEYVQRLQAEREAREAAQAEGHQDDLKKVAGE